MWQSVKDSQTDVTLRDAETNPGCGAILCPCQQFQQQAIRVKHFTLPVWLDTCIMNRRQVGVKVLTTGFFLDKHQTLCDLTYETVMKVTVHERLRD